MNKTIKTLVFSTITLCVCVMIVVGGTYALFSDTVGVKYHLSAGNLDVGLERTSFTKCVLDEDGYMETIVDEEPVNLVTSEKPLFDIQQAVPSGYYEATIKVSNEGTTAFDYGVRILWDRNEANDAEMKFAEQIKITISADGMPTRSFMLVDGAGKDVDLSFLVKGETTKSFTVRAEFVDDKYHTDIVNNNAKGASIEFDVEVYATQKVSGQS